MRKFAIVNLGLGAINLVPFLIPILIPAAYLLDGYRFLCLLAYYLFDVPREIFMVVVYSLALVGYSGYFVWTDRREKRLSLLREAITMAVPMKQESSSLLTKGYRYDES